MKIEQRYTAGTAHLEDRTDGAPAILGTAAVFYDGTAATEFRLWDGAVERLAPTAFDKPIRERQDVRGLFNHDASQLLGRTAAGTMTLKVDTVGLRYHISPGDTTTSKDVREHIRRGDVTGSSFGFMVTDEIWEKIDEVDIRTISGVDLMDVGPVTFPAYEATEAQTRTARQRFKDLGLSQRGVDVRLRQIELDELAGARLY